MKIINKLLHSKPDKSKDEAKKEKRAKKFIERLSKIPQEIRAEEFIYMPVEDLKPICDNEAVLNYILPFCKNETERKVVLSIFNRETEHRKGKNQETGTVV